MSEQLFELRKDIQSPDRYIRAGARKTKEEWLKLYPHCNKFVSGFDDWFIDLSVEAKIDESDIEWRIVDEVFTDKGLISISYKEAAIKFMREFNRVGDKHNSLLLLNKEIERIDNLRPSIRDEKEYQDAMIRQRDCRIAINLIHELSGKDECETVLRNSTSRPQDQISFVLNTHNAGDVLNSPSSDEQ